MQQPNIPRVRAPSDLTQTSLAIVIGNQVYGVPAIDLGDAFGFQPLDADLTSWAAITRATGFDTFVTTPSSANLRSLLTDETGTGAAVFADAPTISGTAVFSGVPSLTGGGLAFPATQVPSANANTLDDYEEDSFTPGLAFAGASVGMTYSAQTGTYTKIGRVVLCNIRVNLSAKGSSTGAATITGLPFTPASIGSAPISYYSAMSGLSGPPGVLVDSFASGLRIYNPGATGSTALTHAAFTDTSDIRLSLWFTV